MADGCLLYYITDRTTFPGDERDRCVRLLDKIAEAATHGVDYIQLREKDLSARDLEALARAAMGVLRNSGAGNRELKTKLLINSRTDVALTVGADGIHLRSDDISPDDVRTAWKRASELGAGDSARTRNPSISVACHSVQQVSEAAANRATLAVFAPVFEKKDAPGTPPAGLETLRVACRANIPVVALGGVNLQNAESCLEAGAAGIAAIRLFQENDIAAIVHRRRG